jgi:hypothetical protein
MRGDHGQLIVQLLQQFCPAMHALGLLPPRGLRNYLQLFEAAYIALRS